MLATPRALCVTHATRLVRAGLGGALAELLIVHRPGGAAGVRALSAALLCLRGPNGTPAAAAAAAAAELGAAFAAAGGSEALARLASRGGAALKAIVALSSACPSALTPALCSAVFGAVGASFDARVAEEALHAACAMLQQERVPPNLLAALQISPLVFGGAALPLVYALACSSDAPLRAAATAVISAAITAEPRTDDMPTPWRALGIAAIPGFVADECVMVPLFANFLSAEAEHMGCYAPALGAALLARCRRSPPPLMLLSRLLSLLCVADAAAHGGRGAGAGGGAAAPSPQHARAAQLGAVATGLLRLLLTSDVSPDNAAWPVPRVIAALVAQHARGERLMAQLAAAGGAPAGALARNMAAQAASFAALGAARAHEAAQEAATSPPEDRALSDLLESLAPRLDASAHAARVPRRERTALRRAALATAACAGAAADPRGVVPRPPGVPSPHALMRLAQRGYMSCAAGFNPPGAPRMEDGALTVLMAQSRGLHYTTGMPELLVRCDRGASPALGRMPGGVAAQLCLCLVDAAAKAATAAAEADTTEEDGDDDDDCGDACVLDAPPRGAAAAWARGVTLREADVGIVPALWAGLLPGAPPPPPAELFAELTWRFAPQRATSDVEDSGAAKDDDFVGSWRDLSASCGGAAANGAVYALHVHASAAWRARAVHLDYDDGVGARALHALPQLLCAADAALAACPALQEAIAALPAECYRMSVTSGDDGDGDDGGAAAAADCSTCAVCTLSRAVGAACALPGCGAHYRAGAGAGADAARPLQRCAACRVAAYCCAEHGAQDWRRHKRECRAAQAAAAAAAART
jgi:hypothetical protein